MRSNPNSGLAPRVDTHIPAGSQVTVTIGRNMGERPMSRLAWDEFRSLVADVVRDHFRPSAVFGPFKGEGEWEGVTEESSVLIAVTSYPASADRFESDLSRIAGWYDQDAVAWSYGPNRLARGE